MPNDPELGPGWAPKKKPRKYPTDYLFDGLCVACNHNRKALCKFDRGRLNKAVRALKEKGVLNDLDGKRLVVARAKQWAKLYGYKGPLVNPMQLVADWDGCGKIGVVKTVQPGQPSRKEQAERDAKLRREHEAAWAWWESLSTSERLAKLNRWSPGTPKGHIVLHEFDRKE